MRVTRATARDVRHPELSVTERNKDWASLVWLGKLFLILPCYLFTLQGFFAVLASKLSPEAELPEDLSAQAGARIDLSALAATQVKPA